ncbi:hypothetical protein GCK32_009964 [Trichostrongylus colubriformis]|uniref:Uncharacterized protein n=1 Tax=Trichostrongylus colubriformis TaxID=6319 RepID=A0AAN8IFE0_TRICO
MGNTVLLITEYNHSNQPVNHHHFFKRRTKFLALWLLLSFDIAVMDLCPPEPIGKDVTFLPFRCSQVSPGTYTLRIYFSQNVDSSIQGNVVVYEKSPNLTVSVALSTNINGDGKSGTLLRCRQIGRIKHFKAHRHSER